MTENIAGLEFCQNCGIPLLVQCPQCGLENEPEQTVCKYCGTETSGLAKRSFLASYEGERRFAVILFADIAGFTHLSDQLDAESATTLVNRCLDAMTKVVAENGGRLIRYTGDGLLAAFGAPRSHENDPERALSSAVIMRDVVNKFDFGGHQIKLHIGLACGVVVTGGVGSEGRKEYNVIGRAVNLASRLEDISEPDQILVDEELARLTRHLFSLTAVDVPPLKGFNTDVKAFELIAPLPKTGPLKLLRLTRTPFIGRAKELEALQNAFRGLEQGQGKVISIIGEAGVGKTRLLYEVNNSIYDLDPRATCLFSSATEMGSGLHYASFHSLINNAINLDPNLKTNDLSSTLQKYLEEVIPDYSKEVYPFFALSLGVPLSQQAIKNIDWLKRDELDERISTSIKIWLRELSRHGPVVLLFDNMHWVDEESASIFAKLLVAVKEMPLLIIYTARPDMNQTYQQIEDTVQLLEDGFQDLLDLLPLSSIETGYMIRGILDDQNIPQNLGEAIYRRSNGNPLYVEEYLQSLLEQNVLTREHFGHWNLASEWDEVPIPSTIQGILQSRIDRLDQSTKRVLQVAATIGENISLDILRSVSAFFGIGTVQLDDILERLLHTSMIEKMDTDDKVYRFKHISIKDTVYNSMLKQNKADIHLWVARWYEEKTLNHEEPPYAMIAHHLENTDEVEKKRFYFREAGHQAARYYTNKAAKEYFDKALALTQLPSDRFDLLLAREKICSLTGDESQRKEDLDEMIRYSDSIDNDAVKAKVFNRLAIWHESRSNYIDAKASFIGGIEASRRINDITLEAENLHHLASVEWRLGNFNDAIQHAHSALKLSRDIKDQQLAAISLTTLGVVYRTLGDTKSALKFYEDALELRRKIGDRRGEATNLSQLGNTFYDLTNYYQALKLHKDAWEAFKLVGDRRGEAWSLSGIGTALLACGDHEAAEEYYQEALRIRRSIGDRRGEGVALADLGNLLLAQEEYENALDNLRSSYAILNEVGSQRDEMYTLKYLAYALEQVGKLDEAASCYEKALNINSQLEINVPDLDCDAGLARIAMIKNNYSLALKTTESIVFAIKSKYKTICEFPFRVYLAILQILKASGEIDKYNEILFLAHSHLSTIAGQIEDTRLQESFLYCIQENAEIKKLWHLYRGSSEVSPS